jgi:hypothetical protein
MINTKLLADKIVDTLIKRLGNCELSAFKSIYVCGSYCRGDWLNSSSDLDIHMINSDNGGEYKEDNLNYIKSIVYESLNGQNFPSHCPSGIEYGFSNISNIPKTLDEALKPSPYAYFSTLMFDFKNNHITVYGDEINDILPETPDPKDNSRAWFLMLSDRIKNFEPDDYRLPFSTYKTIIAAQLYYGEITINKYRMTELYQKYVPDFSTKWFGELVIRNYIGSIYPDRLPIRFPHSEYMAFIDELTYVMCP